MSKIPKLALAIMLILFAFLAVVWPYLFGFWEAKKDFRKIQEDGEKDSLKEDWHQMNAIFRGLVIAVMVGAVYAVLIYHYRVGILFLPAYYFYAAALFGYSFTSNLNTNRGLHKWYVSRDPRASETDKFFVRFAPKFGHTPESFSQFLHTGFVVFSGVLLFAVLWVIC